MAPPRNSTILSARTHPLLQPKHWGLQWVYEATSLRSPGNFVASARLGLKKENKNRRCFPMELETENLEDSELSFLWEWVGYTSYLISFFLFGNGDYRITWNFCAMAFIIGTSLVSFEVMASVSGRHLWESESENWSYKLKDILSNCCKKNDMI